MKQILNDKVAVITGAGGGIGRATAELLAKSRMKLVLLGGNNLNKLAETESLVSSYTECMVIPGDLTDLSFLRQGIAQAAAHFGTIDVLINNAGAALNCSFEEVTEEQFDRLMDIDIKVPFFLTQAALPYLKQSQSATIINIASVTGHIGYPNQSVYSAAKHAMMGFTKSLANEYYDQNIRVHAICPGGVYTDMIRIARPDLTSDGMILPEDIAEMILFLLEHRGNAVIDEINVHRVNKAPFQV